MLYIKRIVETLALLVTMLLVTHGKKLNIVVKGFAWILRFDLLFAVFLCIDASLLYRYWVP
jgi:hypothetical protein